MASGSLDKPGEVEITRNDTDVIPEKDVTMEMVRNTQDNPESWLLYGGGHRNQRHMKQSAIDKDNVGDLEKEWEINLGNRPGEYQGSPLIVPGDPPIMYQTNGPDHLRAINPRTGDILWYYNYKSQAQVGDPSANRGVTILNDTVYFTNLDMGIVALDRYTGEEKWYFNQAKMYRDETIDNPETDIHSELDFTRNVGFSSGYPPIPYEGDLLKGSFGGEYGVSGWIDSITTDGDHNWRFNTTPSDLWVGDAWRHGSATVWQPPAVDLETGTAVFPMGNPGPDFDATVRPGWNQYSTGKLALDASTGEYQWHYQESPHDWWDYDSPSPPIIFEAEARGEERKLVSWPGKSGWFFTFDLETGEMIQRSEGYVEHVNMWALPAHDDLEATPWTAPNLLGGTDPQPPAYDPKNQIMVVKGGNIPWKITWQDSEYTEGELYWGMAGNEFANEVDRDVDIEGWNEKEGVVAGIDPVTGEVLWQNWRELVPWGGLMTTDTGITFAGVSNGEFLALDTETGEELWSDDLGVGVGGDPVSWYDSTEGKQYVAIQGGGEGPLGGYGEKGDVLAVYSVEADLPDDDGNSDSSSGDNDNGGGNGTGGGGSNNTSNDSPGESGPGLGIITGLTGLAGAAGYALSRDDDSKEE